MAVFCELVTLLKPGLVLLLAIALGLLGKTTNAIGLLIRRITRAPSRLVRFDSIEGLEPHKIGGLGWAGACPGGRRSGLGGP